MDGIRLIHPDISIDIGSFNPFSHRHAKAHDDRLAGIDRHVARLFCATFTVFLVFAQDHHRDSGQVFDRGFDRLAHGFR